MSQACAVFVTLLLATWARPAFAENPEAIGSPIEYSVLTPGLQSKFFVVTAQDLTLIGVSHYANMGQSKALRKLVERERYEPCGRLSQQIVAALQAAGHTAIDEPIPRAAPGRSQSLSRMDIPERPRGEVLLDVTIDWIGLRADTSGQSFRPALSLTWRLIGANGQLIAPGRLLTYNGRPAYYSVGDVGISMAPLPSPAPPPTQPNADPGKGCEFKSFKAAADDPRTLWSCFDAAFRGAADLLAIELSRR